MAIANIIFENPSSLKTTSITPSGAYNLEDLNVYTSIASFGTHIQVFLIFKNTDGLTEIIEFTKASATSTNLCWKMPINQGVRVGNEQVEARVLVLDITNNTYSVSSPLQFKLLIDNYQLARQVYFVKEVSNQVQDCYLKMLALVQENERG